MAALVTRGLGFGGPLVTCGLGGGPVPYTPTPYPMRLCWLVLFAGAGTYSTLPTTFTVVPYDINPTGLEPFVLNVTPQDR